MYATYYYLPLSWTLHGIICSTEYYYSGRLFAFAHKAAKIPPNPSLNLQAYLATYLATSPWSEAATQSLSSLFSPQKARLADIIHAQAAQRASTWLEDGLPGK